MQLVCRSDILVGWKRGDVPIRLEVSRVHYMSA